MTVNVRSLGMKTRMKMKKKESKCEAGYEQEDKVA